MPIDNAGEPSSAMVETTDTVGSSTSAPPPATRISTSAACVEHDIRLPDRHLNRVEVFEGHAVIDIKH